MTMDQSLYKIDDVCDILKCSKSTIWRWVSLGSFPKPLKIGGTSRWTGDAVSSVIRAAEQGSLDAARKTENPKRARGLRRPNLSSK